MGWTIDYVASVRKSLEKIDAVGRRRIAPIWKNGSRRWTILGKSASL